MSVLKLIQRFTNKAPQILLSPHDKIADTKMILDNDHGEFMKYNDFLILLQRGVLIENTPAFQEVIADGNAHRALMIDLEKLGYESFDDVMRVLRKYRDTELKEREFEIWCEGFADNGHRQYASLVGKGKGYSFFEACKQYYNTLEDKARSDWRFDEAKGTVVIWGMGLYDNEADARKFLGYPEGEK